MVPLCLLLFRLLFKKKLYPPSIKVLPISCQPVLLKVDCPVSDFCRTVPATTPVSGVYIFCGEISQGDAHNQMMISSRALGTDRELYTCTTLLQGILSARRRRLTWRMYIEKKRGHGGSLPWQSRAILFNFRMETSTKKKREDLFL